jgi:hypothetical protein
MKKLLVIVCLGFVFTLSMNAQVSSYLNKGESGAGVVVNYQGSYDFDGLYGIFSYSHKGILDFSVCLSESYFNEYDEHLMNYDAKDFYYSGEINWWIIREKPTANIDVNFALNVGVESANYKDYTYIGGSYEGFFGGYVGLNANVNFNLPNKWALQPFLINYYGFGNDHSTELVSGGSSLDVKEFYHGISSRYGFSLLKKMDSGNSLIFSITNGLSDYNDHNSFDVGIGYVVAM